MAASPAPRSWWITSSGILLLLALVTSSLAWMEIAYPVLTLANVSRHAGHVGWTYAHVVGGTFMLVFGTLNLYIGATRRLFRFHRQVGYLYLAGGAFGAVLALIVSLATLHGKVVRPFAFDLTVVEDSGFGLAMLAIAWLVCAAMGWRAARNRRIDNHRDWMIRSYVLAWSFVICRLLNKIPAMDVVTNLGGGAGFIWMSWLVPLGITELVLQWKAGGPLPALRR